MLSIQISIYLPIYMLANISNNPLHPSNSTFLNNARENNNQSWYVCVLKRKKLLNLDIGYWYELYMQWGCEYMTKDGDVYL